MGIREWANKNQKQATLAASGIVLLGIGVIVYEVLASRQRYPTDVPDAYYSVDDGQSYFVSKGSNVAPFDYGGKAAVRAYVFATAGGKKFVGLLERYTAANKKLLDQGKPLTAEMVRFGREVKRPGDAKWTPTGNPKVEAAAEAVQIPDGSDPARLVAVDP